MNLVELAKVAKPNRGLFGRFLDLMRNTECVTSVFFVVLTLKSLGSLFISVSWRTQGFSKVTTLHFGVSRHFVFWSFGWLLRQEKQMALIFILVLLCIVLWHNNVHFVMVRQFFHFFINSKAECLFLVEILYLCYFYFHTNRLIFLIHAFISTYYQISQVL